MEATEAAVDAEDPRAAAGRLVDSEWAFVLGHVAGGCDIEASAREHGAIERARAVASAGDLLRLALGYSVLDLSLRSTSAWAAQLGIATMSDVAVLKRLRGATRWLGVLVGKLLAQRTEALREAYTEGFRMRVLDATTSSRPGSDRADWRCHAAFDLGTLRLDHVEVTDRRGGEQFQRFHCVPGELLLADAGYPSRQGIAHVAASGAHLLVRANWQSLPLLDAEGRPVDYLALARKAPAAEPVLHAVSTAPAKSTPAVAGRLIILRKSPQAVEQAQRRMRKERSRKGKPLEERSLEAAAYIFLFTTLETLSPTQALELYRFRWQVELAFKRLKSLLHLDALRAKDPDLAQTYLYAKLLAAILVDDLTEHQLGVSPWGYAVPRPSRVHLARPEVARRRAARRGPRPGPAQARPRRR